MTRLLRERQERLLFRADLPRGVLVPAGPPRWPGIRAAASLLPAPVRRAVRAVAVEAAVFVLVSAALAAVTVHTVAQLSPPPVPSSEQVCGSSSLDGPSSPPGGAVTVPAGDNSGVNFTIPGTTYWFAAGTHTVGSGLFSQIQPGNGSTFTGAPGAVISGQGLNQFAFASDASDVTIEYLTIEDFIPPGSQGAVNPNGEPDWTTEYDTMQDNVPGAAMMLGTGSVVSGNCLTENGQYAFNGFSVNDVSPLTGGPSDVTLTGNEISYNDTCNWEDSPGFPITPPSGCTGAGQFAGCGCSGGGKFWEVDGATVTGNYVHDNYSVGLWPDTDNTGFTITGNYISGNFAEGIIYEISYNALISGNVFARNGLGTGPYVSGTPAIYISESGSDPRVPGPYGTQFDITGNQFYDNWTGVVLWENSDRFCSSPANSSGGACTLVDPSAVNLQTCSYNTPAPVSPSRPVQGPVPPGRRTAGRGAGGQGQNFRWLINTSPYIDDCRWKTQDVKVSGNLFDFDASAMGAGCTNATSCGFSGVFSEFGIIPPYVGTSVENNITFSQGNLFSGNTYCGPWQFTALEQGAVSTFAQWQGSPYAQDPGSTLNGPSCGAQPPVPGRGRGMQNRPVTIPVRAGRR